MNSRECIHELDQLHSVFEKHTHYVINCNCIVFVLSFTSSEMGKASGAQNAHELVLHVIRVSVACIG